MGIGHYDVVVRTDIPGADASLEQVPAAAASARAVAAWFLDRFDNADRPLKSLSLVISGGEQAETFDHARAISGGRLLPTGAMADTLPAIRAWQRRASTHVENMSVFFFSGHGVSTGEPILLLRDYGIDPENRFDGAINFNDFASAMLTKAPRDQLFLVDACKIADPLAFSPVDARHVGRSCIEPSAYSATTAGQSVHHSTSDMTAAYVKTVGHSLFTEALLKALDGGGAQGSTEWSVNTLGLQSALSHYVERLAKKFNVEQYPHVTRCHRFKINRPKAIHVPLYVCSEPSAAMKNARVEILGTGPADYYDSEEHPPTEEWMTVLAMNRYTVVTTFKEHLGYEHDRSDPMVTPPEAIHRIICRIRP